MIKLLKIASFIAIIIAGVSVAIAGIAIYRGSDAAKEREEFISQETIIDQVKKILGDGGNVEPDKTSPLVGQAKELSLRIDPPPPPKPPKPPERKEVKVTRRRTEKPDPPKPDEAPVIQNKNYKLVGTCRYENYPEKSIAMIDVVSEGTKLLRQGDKIGRDVIHEIRDGSIVVYQNGRQTGVYHMPREPQMKSLLKDEGSEVTATLSGQPDSSPGNRHSATTADRIPNRENHRTRTLNRGPGISTRRNIRDRTRYRTPAPKTGSGSTSRLNTGRLRSAPKRVLSPEEQKEKMERSISNIKNIISETQSSATTEEQKKKDTEALQSLLKLLKSESKTPKRTKSASSNNKNAIPGKIKEKEKKQDKD